MEIGLAFLAGLVAMGVTVLATPVVAHFAKLMQVVDRPNDRKVSERADIPLLGGLAVAIGFFVGLGVLLVVTDFEFSGHLEALFLGGALLMGIGAWDDRYEMGWIPKLTIQVLAAAVAIFFGFEIDQFREPFVGKTFFPPVWVIWPVTTLWIVGITNSVNLIDGLDGLATGVGAIIAVTLIYICWQAGQNTGVYIGLVFLGALLGFLFFNFPPAKIFLGDTGALFIGFVLSLLALESYRKISLLTFVVPLLALAVPILDTLLSILRRMRNRSAIFSPDRSHMHHKLLDSSGSHRNAVLSIYFLTSCFCVIAVSFLELEGWAAFVFLALVVVLTIRLLKNLGYFEVVEESQVRTATGGSTEE